MCCEAQKAGDMLLSFFTILISEFGASRWKIEAPQTISLAPGDLLEEIGTQIWFLFLAVPGVHKWNEDF